MLPEALRGVDLLLLTHAHFDHLDKPTLTGMVAAATTVVVPPACARLVPEGFGCVIELAVGRAVTIDAVEVEAIEPRHWGARVAVDRHRGVNSYLVRSTTTSALFTGDTAATDAFDVVEDVDIAVFGIGSYEPWDHMHATPEQVWAMFRRCGARYLLPVHHSTYELGDEPAGDPMLRLLCAAGEERECVLESEPGEVVVLGAPESVEGDG
jgi:L-ascorbate metabolism protein UlaG (beta-lactamase superfamily)